MKRWLWIPVFIIPILFAGCATMKEGTMSRNKSSDLLPGQHAEVFKKKISITVACQYLLYLPDGYATSHKKWPLIMFLHGSGERGDDINKVKIHGPPMLVDEGKKLPFIIVSPQAPEDTREFSNHTLMALLKEVESKYRVDKNREYLTGLSMGGYGTWRLAMAYPDKFAAIAPVCGWGNTKNVCRLKNVPVWAFHGAKDKSVNIKDEQDLVDALKACGGDVKFTIYPDLGHNAWTVTYANDELYKWFLDHKK